MPKDTATSLIFLPLCSPDFNTIQMAFAKLKAALQEATVRTVEAHCDTIPTHTPKKRRNYFDAAGYDPA